MTHPQYVQNYMQPVKNKEVTHGLLMGEMLINPIGKVFIHDIATGEQLLEKKNAIHPQNMARAIARALAGEDNGGIFKMVFGNGGTYINGLSQVVYKSPNTLGATGLYNQTYEVQVDERDSATPLTNSVVSVPSPAPAITSLAIVTARLGANEPSGQASSDDVTVDPESDYTFDEIGLMTSDGLLLSHLVFNPIEKTANRAFLITYSLTISAV